uniref:Dienelactone hydrolase family protein n=1 Tax=Tetraselmis sp. GSL018 TaxID=582737 RepID=A0A061QT32_9CHLO
MAASTVSATYTPQGTREKVGDLEIYFVGSGPPVVVVYDIFGFDYPQLFQVCDRIASAGFSVGMPDMFRGSPWTKDKFPPKPEDNFMGWVKSQSDFYWKVKPDIDATVSLLRRTDAVADGKAAVIGFCWGGAMSLQAASDPKFGAVACVHPNFKLLPGMGGPAADEARCPVALMPAKGDDVEKVKDGIYQKEFVGKCLYKEFPEQVHGFMAARGDWTDPKVAAAATEGIEKLCAFLRENLLESS